MLNEPSHHESVDESARNYATCLRRRHLMEVSVYFQSSAA